MSRTPTIATDNVPIHHLAGAPGVAARPVVISPGPEFALPTIGA